MAKANVGNIKKGHEFLILFLLAVLSGCAIIPQQINASSSTQWVAPIQSGQEWKGFYVCQQGATNLTLKIDSISSISNSQFSDVAAIFDFNFNNGSCVGQFYLRGQYDAVRHSLRFEPGQWLYNPCNYVTVGMDGIVDRTGKEFNGRITKSDGCKEFRLTLTE
jgi:hypothetical protein